MTKFTTTQEIIDKSIPGSTQSCVLANTVKPFLGDRFQAVGSVFIHVWNADHSEVILIRLPEIAYLKAFSFDQGKPIIPFEFELDLSEVGL